MVESLSISSVVVLAIFTICVITLTAIWLCARHRSSVAIILVLFFLYFWTLHGVWGVIDVDNQRSGYGFHYLFAKLFPVRPDQIYLKTITYYCIFIWVFCISLFIFSRSTRQRQAGVIVKIKASYFLIGILVYLAFSTAMLYSTISLSYLSSQAFYALSGESEGWSRGKKFLDAATTLSYLGLALIASQSRGCLVSFSTAPSQIVKFGFFGAVLITTFLAIVVGSKSMIFSGVISGLVFFQVNYGPMSASMRTKLIAAAALGVALMAFINVARGFSLGNINEVFSVEGLLLSIQLLLFSNEAFGAHFSMYGVLAQNVQPSPDLAAFFLIDTLLPFDAGPALSTYEYYADSVGALPGQGYSIHYATATYLNFGIFGLVLGAVLLAWVFSFFLRICERQITSSSLLVQGVAIFGLALFVGSFPIFLRGGFEAYRAVAITMLLPMLVLVGSLRVLRSSAKAP